MEAQDKERPYDTRFKKVVDIAQAAFYNDKLANEFTWKALVLMPKGVGEFHIIDLVDILWKAISIIMDKFLGKAI